MDKYEIEQELMGLKYQLGQLLETKLYQDYEVKGLDVYTHQERTTKGSKIEMERTKQRINELKESLRKIEIMQRQKEKDAPKEKAKREAREKFLRNEELRKQQEIEINKKNHKITFEKVKKEYKNIGKWNRFLNLIQGKTPDWKKVKGYTKEELEHVLNVYAGRTLTQQEKHETMKNYNQNKPVKTRLDLRELRKKMKEQDKAKFVALLKSRYKLESDMELEEILENKGIRR